MPYRYKTMSGQAAHVEGVMIKAEKGFRADLRMPSLDKWVGTLLTIEEITPTPKKAATTTTSGTSQLTPDPDEDTSGEEEDGEDGKKKKETK